MDEFDYKPNSHKYKEEQKQLEERKVEKVVTGKVMTKKKNGINKFVGEFISDDAKNVKSYILGDVIIPTIKKVLYDIVTDGADIILYGETKRNKRGPTDRISYRSYYEDRYSRPRIETQTIRNSYSYDDIIFSTRSDAEGVLDRMDELIARYGLVRVADLYDLAGLTGNPTDNAYGWTNINSAEIIRARDGFMIKMPRAIIID